LQVALRLLEPGGTLLAQGPLEGNASLFTGAILASQWLRRRAARDDTPTHVMLATAAGQQALFQDAGLRTEQFHVYEVDWPAPSRLRRSDLRHLRRVGLFSVRQLSKLCSGVLPRWGNRYTYVGTLLPASCGP
jgi:hypothetical protein